MSADTARTDNYVLGFKDLWPGIKYRLPRIGRALRAVRGVLGLKMSDRNSLGKKIEENAERWANRPAVLYQDQRLTHGQFNRAANRYANHFLSLGLGRGESVLAFLENRPEILEIVVACSKTGTMASLINPNQRGKVLLHSVNLTRGRVMIVGEEMVEAFEEIRHDMALTANDLVYFLPDGTDSPAPEGYIDLTGILAESSDENPATTSEMTMADNYAYVFTSGTTGLPKASIQVNFRWIAAGYWFADLNMNLTRDDVMYVPLPFYHTNGLVVAWAAAAKNGSALAIRRKFSARGFLEDARRFGATSFVYIGEVCRYLINQPEKQDDRNNPITKMVGNGLRPDIWKRFKQRFGIPYVYELYGAAESSLVFTNFFNLDCTVGMCLTPFTIVRYDIDADAPVLDGEGRMQKVAPGEAGLLLGKITDKTPFAGYTDKDATEKKVFKDVFEEGDAWFNTGDLMRDIGFRHAQFVDRLGDTFRYKGENVSTTEVEEVINTLPGVAGSTVYGVQIPGVEGRAGMASVVTESLEDDLDRAALLERLRESLPSYAVPVFLRVKTGFETTATHKIKKTDLKAQGFDPSQVSDPLYLLLAGEDEYLPISEEIFREIGQGKHRF